MRKLILYLAAAAPCMLISCSEPGATPLGSTSRVADAEYVTLASSAEKDVESELEYSEFQPYFILMAGAGYNYDSLSGRASEIAGFLHVPFNQYGRVYERGKGIIVPYNDEDEMYRGAYYPRRNEGDEVSIEMADYFATEGELVDSAKMAIVAGMFETPEKAEQALQKVKVFAPEATLVKREVYIGCMH